MRTVPSPERPRVPDDVARRLRAVAAGRAVDGAPRTGRGPDAAAIPPTLRAPVTATGWTPTPRTAATDHWSAAVRRQDLGDPSVAPPRGWHRLPAGPVGEPEVMAGEPGAGSRPEHGPWPEVPSAREVQPERASAEETQAGTASAGESQPETEAAQPETEAQHAARVHVARVRWLPGWRAAGGVVLVLALVAGGVALRVSAAPGASPVEVPTPFAIGGAQASDPGGGQGGDGQDGDGQDGDGRTGDGTITEAGQQVVVHVVGAVAQPGVVRLALGARVADALTAAGGGTADADLGAVNLARVLTDGEQLLVPVVGAEPAGPPASAAVVEDGLVDLNRADPATLETLPGVGPVLAERIVRHREEQPFTTVDELDDVPGIGPSLMSQLRALVRV